MEAIGVVVHVTLSLSPIENIIPRSCLAFIWIDINNFYEGMHQREILYISAWPCNILNLFDVFTFGSIVLDVTLIYQ